MSNRNVGLGAYLKFSSGKAVSEMGRVNRALKGMMAGVSRVSSGVSKMSAGFNKLAMAGTGVAVALGFGVRSAVKFEQGMSGVNAVLMKSSAETAALRTEALRLGSTTTFTATEASNAMENLARAGFSQNEIISATGAVLNAAAADAMGLAEAADIVANVTRAMGLEAKDASRVADVLALTSAKTNTNITMLGEGFKYAATQSKNLGIPLEETSAVLGLMANAGLKGSMGGTSFTNMLVKMTKPTATAKRMMSELGAEFVVATDKFGKKRVDLIDTVHSIAAGFKDIKDPVKKAAMVTEIFGLRGQKAVGSFLGQLEKNPRVLSDLYAKLEDANGAAAKMAEIRLDNVAGQMTLLKSAVEGLTINFFSMFNSQAKGGLKSLAKGIGNISVALQYLTTDPKQIGEKFQKMYDELPQGAKDTAAALQSAAITIRNAWTWVGNNVIKPAKEWFNSLTPEAKKTLVTVTLGATALVGVMGPLSLAIATVGFIASGVASVVAGAFSVMAGAIWPVTLVVGALAAAYFALRRDGETPLQFMARAWTNLKTAVMDFAQGFKSTFMPMWEPLKELYASAIKPIWDSLKGMFADIFGGGNTTAASFKQIGAVVGTVFGFIATVVGTVMQVVGVYISNVIDGYIRPMIRAVQNIAGGFIDLVTGATSMKSALARIFGGVADIIILPFKYSISKVLAIIEGLGKAVGLKMEGVAKARKVVNDFSIAGLLTGGKSEGAKPTVAPPVKNPIVAAGPTAPVASPVAMNTAAAAPKVDVNVEAPPPPNVNQTTVVKLDGKEIAAKVVKNQIDYDQRAGNKSGSREAAKNYGAGG